MINSFYQSLLWCLKWEKKRSANLNGPFCKIMKFLYMVVLQSINPNIATYRAAAQKLKKPVQTQLGLFIRLVEAYYQILSKSDEKQKNSISILAPIAPQDLSEMGNVWNSRFLKSRHGNHDLIAKIMVPGIFRLNTCMSVTYCYKIEIFFVLGIFLHASTCGDQQGTIKFVRNGKCLKFINHFSWGA